YPFGSTNTPRNFVGCVIYEPALTGLTWIVSSDTVISTSFTAQRTTGVVAQAYVGTSLYQGAEILEVTDLDVDVQASPVSIQSGQSSTLSSTVTVSKGLVSTFEAGNNQNGSMFDVVASADADITGFSIFPQSGSPDIEIFYKTGT